MLAHASVQRKFEALATIDPSMPRTEEDLTANNMIDSFVQALIPISEALLEYFLKCDLMVGLCHFVSNLIFGRFFQHQSFYSLFKI